MKKQLLVIGNGMVGHHFAEQLMASDKADEFQLQILPEKNTRPMTVCIYLNILSLRVRLTCTWVRLIFTAAIGLIYT